MADPTKFKISDVAYLEQGGKGPGVQRTFVVGVRKA